MGAPMGVTLALASAKTRRLGFGLHRCKTRRNTALVGGGVDGCCGWRRWGAVSAITACSETASLNSADANARTHGMRWRERTYSTMRA